MKRVIGSIFIVLSFIMFFMQIKGCIVKDYEYQNKIEYAWNLADKSSTLSEKSKYIEEFVTNIKKEKFAANNAVLFKTKDNSFVYNLLAVESLNKRLKEISKMDETSFAYQTAIQQITAQEQGEAVAMLCELKGCWILENYYYLWDWYGAIFFIASLFTCAIGFVIAFWDEITF